MDPLDEASTGSLSSSGLVLLVDDEITAAGALAEALQAHQWQVVALTGLDEAARWLSSHTPDVIMLDYRLPGVSGLFGLRRVLQAAAGAPVLLYTGGEIDPGLTSEAVAAGAAGVDCRSYWYCSANEASPRVLGALRLHTRLVEIRERARRDLLGSDARALLAQLVELSRLLVASAAVQDAALAQVHADLAVILARLPESPRRGVLDGLAELIPLIPKESAVKLLTAIVMLATTGVGYLIAQIPGASP